MFFNWLKYIDSNSSPSPLTHYLSFRSSWLNVLLLAIWTGNFGSPTPKRNLNPTKGIIATVLKGEWSSPTKHFHCFEMATMLRRSIKLFFIFPTTQITRTYLLKNWDLTDCLPIPLGKGAFLFKKRYWKRGKAVYVTFKTLALDKVYLGFKSFCYFLAVWLWITYLLLWVLVSSSMK